MVAHESPRAQPREAVSASSHAVGMTAEVQTPAFGASPDELLEMRIDSLAWALAQPAPRERLLAVWRLMVRLIGERSPEQVERMERERGLRS